MKITKKKKGTHLGVGVRFWKSSVEARELMSFSPENITDCCDRGFSATSRQCFDIPVGSGEQTVGIRRRSQGTRDGSCRVCVGSVPGARQMDRHITLPDEPIAREKPVSDRASCSTCVRVLTESCVDRSVGSCIDMVLSALISYL